MEVFKFFPISPLQKQWGSILPIAGGKSFPLIIKFIRHRFWWMPRNIILTLKKGVVSIIRKSSISAKDKVIMKMNS